MIAPALSYGSGWGAAFDYETGSSGSTSELSKPGSTYLLRKLIQGEPVRVYLNLCPEALAKADEYQEMITKVYQQWFRNSADFIHRAQREAEFKDVLPILKQSVTVEFVQDKEQADIVFTIHSKQYVETYCGKDAVACYKSITTQRPKPEIILMQYTAEMVRLERLVRRLVHPSLSAIAMHEVGHSLGLSDQYKKAGEAQTHDLYSSTKRGQGLMNSKRFSCDEVDGIINLIDITRQVRSARNDKGWRSFCKESTDVYSYGKPLSRGQYWIYSTEHPQGLTGWYVFYGKESKSVFFPWTQSGNTAFFTRPAKTETEFDGLGRVLRATNSAGETIIYSYGYDEVTRLVTKNGEVVAYEKRSPIYIGSIKAGNEYTFKGRVNGEWIEVYARQTKILSKQGYMVYQVHKRVQDKLDGKILLHFNKNNQIVERHFKGTLSPNTADSVRQGKDGKLISENGWQQAVDQAVVEHLVEQMKGWYQTFFEVD